MNSLLPSILQAASNICIVAPHQDDEVLGLGGTISKLLKAEKKVTVLFSTDGSKGIKRMPKFITKQIRLHEFKKVNNLLEDKLEVKFLNFPDGELVEHKVECQKQLLQIFSEIKPDLIFATNPEDYHPDHQASFEITKQALKEAHELKAKLLIYEVWSPLLNPDILVNISEEAELKRQLIRQYESQTKQLDFEFSIMGLNAYRSMRLTKKERIQGKENYVEAFCEIKFRTED